MAADPALPADLRRDFADLERRIRVLETSNRLASSSVRGGTFQVLDADGAIVARVGRLGGTADGFDAQADGGTVGMMHVSNQLGWALPYVNVSSWVRPAEAETVTSGIFVEAWRARAEQNLSLHVRFTCYIGTDAGTTGEVRVLFGGVQIGTTAPILSVPGGHGAYHQFAAPTNGVLFAGPYSLAIEARRTAGTGNLYIYRPYAAVMGKFELIPVTGWTTP